MSRTSRPAVEERPVTMDWSRGALAGPAAQERVRNLGQLQGLFYDVASWRQIDPAKIVYRVRWWEPVPEGTEGGLFWGTTIVEPGRVGDEYFMTHGHSHLRGNRAEIYSTISGEGSLLLSEGGGRVRLEPMTAGSMHYIRGDVAHRAANVGERPLVFVACWPSDARHDYGGIVSKGFGAHLVCRNGIPTLLGDGPNAR